MRMTETTTTTTTTTSTTTPTTTTTPLTQEIESMQAKQNYERKRTAATTLRGSNNAGNSRSNRRLQYGQTLYFFQRTATSLHETWRPLHTTRETTFSQSRHDSMPPSFLHHRAHLALILALCAIHEAWITIGSLAVLATLVASNALRLEPPNRQHLSTRRVKQVCDSHERLVSAQVWHGILTPTRRNWRLRRPGTIQLRNSRRLPILHTVLR